MIIHAADAAAMEAAGGRLAIACPQGLKIFLHGQLGAGKTTLVRGFLRALGHSGNVKSPTYTLVEPYQLADRILYHFDLYRLNDPQELENIGLRDYYDRAAICLIEWPEQAGTLLGRPDLDIHIGILDSGRTLKLIPRTPAGEKLLSGLTPDC